MRDSEDIINSITAYISEDVGGGVSRLNSIINAVNIEKDDDKGKVANVSNDIDDIILNQRIQEVNTFKNGRVTIDIISPVEVDNVYDSAARAYMVEIGYIMRDNFVRNTFLKALRMERILSDLMLDYLPDTQEPGLMEGKIERTFTPESVFLGNTNFKAIRSGILYKLIIN